MPHLNDLEYHIVSDGIYWEDGGGAFGLVPRTIWSQRFPPNDKNLIPFSLNCLLIYSEGKTILVDTGFGTKLTEKQRLIANVERPDGGLLANLEKLGVRAADINIVVNTHLHGDHCGGNTMLQDGNVVPTFPNARYMIQRLEYSDAIMPNERTRATYFPDNYRPLREAGQLDIINGNTTITPHVRTAITRGHTRAHQVIILESGDEKAIFMADMATLPYHFERLAWVTCYDVEPLESIETKRYWQPWAIDNDALLIFQHSVQIPFGKLRVDGKRYKVEAVEVS